MHKLLRLINTAWGSERRQHSMSQPNAMPQHATPPSTGMCKIGQVIQTLSSRWRVGHLWAAYTCNCEIANRIVASCEHAQRIHVRIDNVTRVAVAIHCTHVKTWCSHEHMCVWCVGQPTCMLCVTTTYTCWMLWWQRIRVQRVIAMDKVCKVTMSCGAQDQSTQSRTHMSKPRVSVHTHWHKLNFLWDFQKLVFFNMFSITLAFSNSAVHRNPEVVLVLWFVLFGAQTKRLFRRIRAPASVRVRLWEWAIAFEHFWLIFPVES